MADLATVLTDPNFVNANPATKQAIFEKWAPQDPNFANANPATQQAIMQKFGVGAAPAPAMPALPQSLQMSVRPAMPEAGIPAGPRQAPQQGPTTGQQIYQAVRPYAAPLVEAGGAIGGGLVGGTAGTFGAGPVGTAVGGIAGAGLGYGMAKELLQAADVAMGVEKPRQGMENVTKPVENIIEGSMYETGGRLAANVLGKVVGKIADLRQIPEQKAAEIARNALGKDLPDVLNALRNAPAGVNAAQATAGITNPTWQALIERRLASDPKFVLNLKNMNEAEGVNALAKLAGGSTASEVRGTLDASKNALNAMTSPQREAALNRGNLGKSVAEYEAQAGKLSTEAAAEVQKVRDLISAGKAAEAWARLDLIKRGLPVGASKYTYGSELAEKAFGEWSNKAATGSLDLGQGARFAQAAADAMRAVGIKPLEGAPLVKSITAIANKPEYAGNDILAGAVKTVADDIAKWTSSGGVIDLKALDAIRKNSVNAAIQQLRPGADATTQRNLASSVLTKVKPLIDDAIEAAGGTGYKQYLADYAKGMQQIAERKLSGEALNLFKTNKDAFVRLVQGESPEAVEKILGPGSYNIAKEVSDNTLNVLQDQAAKVVRDLNIKTQAAGGQEALKELLLQNMSKFRLPSYITAVAATTNKAVQILENKIGVKTMNTLTEAFKTPQGTADLLNTLPAVERNRVLKLLSDPTQWKTSPARAAGGATAASVNALATEEPQNALADTRVIQLNNMLPGRP